MLLVCCKQKYDPPVSSPATGYLVVEGYISATGPAEIHLSRSIPLNDTARVSNESLAKVLLQGNDNSTYNLTESTPGVYINSGVALNNTRQYRLYIKTKDGKEYASDYVKVKNAPDIDGIDWAMERGGLQIYVNTHDPQNNTWYYRWETEETWEFHSNYLSALKFKYDSEHTIIGVEYRRPDKQFDQTIYTCWQTENSSNILLGSSAKLSQDVMHFPLVHITDESWKLSVLYSLNIKQYALSKEEYEYLLKMKNNSEATGSIFDRQPSELTGNIRCLTTPAEPVIGFIGIANRIVKRYWIKRSDIPDWKYTLYCQTKDIPTDSAFFYPQFMPLLPTSVGPNGDIWRYQAAETFCVDCTVRGTNVKPSFWP
jgi:hypothetical protein